MSQQDDQKPDQEEATDQVQEQAVEGELEEAAEPQEPSLEEQLASAQADLVIVKKALAEADVRAQAEVQNMRRRVERDVEAAHKFALEKFAKDILAVVDGLERGVQSLDAEADAKAIEGMELTLKVLIDTLKKYNIEQISPEGEPFDPQVHEAMSMVPNPELEPNTVMNVVATGFSLNGRLLRPAMVIVSS